MRHWAPIAAYKLKKFIEQAQEGPFKHFARAWMQNQIQYDECDASIGGPHILEMLDKIISGEVEGNKANRWLGWVQCAMVAAGITDLEEMKRINKEASESTVECPKCKGSGHDWYARADLSTDCPNCDGSGKVYQLTEESNANPNDS